MFALAEGGNIPSIPNSHMRVIAKYKMMDPVEYHLTQADKDSTYGLGGVVLLLLSTVLSFDLIEYLHVHLVGRSEYSYYYDAPISILVIVAVVVCHRPRPLGLSRWMPRFSDFAIAVPVGALVVGAEILLAPQHIRPLPQPSLFLPVLIGPIADELLMRGVLLRSLREREPISHAIVIVVFLGALGHVGFWSSIPAQLAISIVYVALGNSLPASLITHITMNAVGLLAIARLPHR